MTEGGPLGGYERISDDAIIERVRNGETQLYEVLVRRHKQRLFRIARAILCIEENIEDVVQEAFLKAFSRLAQYEGRALFSTWLTRILINCARECLRRRLRRGELSLDTLVEHSPDAADRLSVEFDADRRMLAVEERRVLDSAIERLPASYRDVFVMRDVEGLSVAQTAASLGLTQVNVKVRHYRARRLLREHLGSAMDEIMPHRFGGARSDKFTA